MKPQDVPVVILCGGKGTRLRDTVGNLPKPMADIAGHPFLFRLIEHFCARGFRRFVLSAGYRAGAIRSQLSGIDKSCRITFVEEPGPLGTGGALRYAARMVPGSFALVTNGDSFCRMDYRRLLAFHVRRRASVTLAVVKAQSADRNDVGLLQRRRDGTIVQFDEKIASKGRWINAGVYVFNTGTIGSLPRKTPLSLEKDVFPHLVGRGLFGYVAPGPLVDIGTPERYSEACRILPRLM